MLQSELGPFNSEMMDLYWKNEKIKQTNCLVYNSKIEIQLSKEPEKYSGSGLVKENFVPLELLLEP